MASKPRKKQRRKGRPANASTPQREAIRAAMEAANSPLTPKEILEHAQEHVEGLGLATVYRTLNLLAQAGVVQTVEIPGGAPRFELAGKGHHHHFYCRGCERVFELEGCPGNFAELSPKGFNLEGHELVLFGTCDACGRR
ncbi:MAG: transcriptional repressor [Planctomycetes bacterium]|nr:transcriptional repressor [Planctomycetota bacterium]